MEAADQAAFLADLGLAESVLAPIRRTAYGLLDLISQAPPGPPNPAARSRYPHPQKSIPDGHGAHDKRRPAFSGDADANGCQTDGDPNHGEGDCPYATCWADF
jgi:hypothetical protein